MKLFDSHCHPQFPQYESDRDEMLERALKGDVFMLCVGTDLKTSQQAIELAQKYENIWATVGLHPNDNLSEKFNSEAYEKLLNRERVVGFGEIGLDYYRTEKAEDQKTQKQIFRKQLELAEKIKKPLVIHCRDSKAGSSGKAHMAMLEILKNYPALKGVIHSFTGTADEAKKYLDMGFCLGFNGIITFTDQYDEVVKYVPLEKILLETDAPFLAPVPFRGKRNEPLYVKHVAEKIAELKGLGYNQVAEKTFENAVKLFGLKT
ncbi:MAG: TatD family hydrolase [Parcubacteria group bacterium]|nr:TatD family hydrolase [Parcubacteria group bacterium]